MNKKLNLYPFFRFLVAFLAAVFGGGIAVLLLSLFESMDVLASVREALVSAITAGSVLLFGFVGWLIAPALYRLLRRWSVSVDGMLSETPLAQIVSGLLGLVIGMIIAALVTRFFYYWLPSALSVALSTILYLMLGYLGATLGAHRWPELPSLFGGRSARQERKAQPPSGADKCASKIMDTSVIIDGRIFDVCKTGFVEGPLVIPQFVLDELRHIADSSDPLRRNRGRRGLDILAQIQNELDIEVQITDADFEDVPEVDVKLLKLAQETGGVVVTNDFNLNKVASVTGVKVLNLNDLAGALRPVLLPGEEMIVQIIREGKEHGQGVGYLDDGTMIVVDNGKRHIGQTVDVVVTTVLQTSAGRMIFTKIKDAA